MITKWHFLIPSSFHNWLSTIERAFSFLPFTYRYLCMHVCIYVSMSVQTYEYYFIQWIIILTIIIYFDAQTVLDLASGHPFKLANVSFAMFPLFFEQFLVQETFPCLSPEISHFSREPQVFLFCFILFFEGWYLEMQSPGLSVGFQLALNIL